MQPYLISARSCSVVLVDHQERLMPIVGNSAEVLGEAACLATAARKFGVPVIGTEQTPNKLGALACHLRSQCDAVIQKSHFNACEDDLVESLASLAGRNRRQIVIAGCETHICLLQTAMGLIEAGFTLWVAETASGSRITSDHVLALQRLQQAGARIVSTEMVLFEWLRTSECPQFRKVLKQVKKRYQ